MLLRALAVAVSEGKPWLGQATKQGRVLYYAGDDPRKRTRRGFAALEPRCTDRIRMLFLGQEPDLWTQAREWRPSLIVVETISKLCGFKDINDYAEVVPALGRLQELADETDAHPIASHHAKKRGASGENVDWDDVLGSVGFRGSVDAMFLLRETDGVHSISAKFRDGGEEIEETVFTLDERDRPSLGPSRKEYGDSQRESAVIEFLTGQDDPIPFEVIDESVRGAERDLRRTVKKLVKDQKVQRTGEGKKGDQYLYAICEPPF